MKLVSGSARRAMAMTFAILVASCATGSESHASSPQSAGTNRPGPVCGGEASPYRDFDFLIGHWDYIGEDGEKLGEHLYTGREQGCLILEDWTSVTGSTGTGMSFVDPATGQWRQVWMSPLFHIDYSGGLTETGAMVLEGRIYPNSGQPSSPVRGIWTPQEDGSVVQEFLIFNANSNEWQRLLIGTSHRRRD